MRKYMVILPVFQAQASAFSLSRYQSRCIDRCNRLPFKIAVETRREACIEGCGPSVDAVITTDTVLTAASRDTVCVQECNATRSSRRVRPACIRRCSKLSEVNSIEKDKHNEQTAAVQKAKNKSSLSLVSIYDLANSTSEAASLMAAANTSQVHTSEKVLNNATTNQTEVETINDDVTIVYKSSTAAQTNSTNDTAAQALQEVVSEETLTEMPVAQSEATEFNNVDDHETANDFSIVAQKETPSHQAEDLGISKITNEAVQSRIPVNQTDTTVSTNSTSVGFQSDGIKATLECNDIADVIHNEPSKLNIELDASYVRVLVNSSGIDRLSQTTIAFNEKSDRQSNQILVAPSAAPEAASIPSAELSPSQNDSSVGVEFRNDSVTLYPNQECADKCNGKRTLKRKRDACLKRCDRNVSSGSVTLLSKGYDSAKFEL